jgi:hypothetical protein
MAKPSWETRKPALEAGPEAGPAADGLADAFERGVASVT